MTDLKIIKLIEDEIEYNKMMFDNVKQFGLNNKYSNEYIYKIDALYSILDKIKEEISNELEMQYKGVKND